DSLVLKVDNVLRVCRVVNPSDIAGRVVIIGEVLRDSLVRGKRIRPRCRQPGQAEGLRIVLTFGGGAVAISDSDPLAARIVVYTSCHVTIGAAGIELPCGRRRLLQPDMDAIEQASLIIG